MKNCYPKLGKIFLLVLLVVGGTFNTLRAQISFDQSQLDFNGLGNVASGVTSLMYGPDGRLYVQEYPGLIKILTIARNSSTDYVVTAIEELNGIQTIQDYNDDGSIHASPFREATGITVGGTAANPVIYASSSDFRIGAGTGGGNGDVGLDTNSGIITRFSWNGTSWDVVDIVRGLPRSEENHATNGLELVNIGGTEYLMVAQGGHTNGGAPSTNFVFTCEYTLSAAVLAIDLDMIDSMPVLDDNGRSYVYDLPTLDDPTRANVNGITDPDDPGYDGIDVNDPFGGNDGLNMAVYDPSGPVKIVSPGYRNAYDLVVTESGALYVTDNGANGGWGGFPENEGGGSATNEYNPSEPGSSSSSGGEQINNVDHLQLVTTDLQSYTFGSYYGGHPNPVRANPNGAGLYTDDGTNAVWRTAVYDPDGSTPGSTTDPTQGLPANWPPISFANTVEGDWRGPGINNPDGTNDNEVLTWGTNTNGIDEYTASNFGGLMQGDLIAGVNTGVLRRVQLAANGTSSGFEPNFLSGIGGDALGVSCNSDFDVFPGTIWAGTLNGKIVVFEPVDFSNCILPGEPGYDANADYDSDGYSNQDEEDNGTDPCNGGSQPQDFDKDQGGTLISDLNDTDDDFDGIADGSDPFQLGNPSTTGSDAFVLPVINDLFNTQQGLGGIFGLGMTGLMNNGDTGANWLDWIDRVDDPNDPNPNDVLGGAPGIMTSHMTPGTALGVTNTQEKGYQYGVQTDVSTGVFTVTGGMNGFTGPLRLYGNTAAIGGELGFFIGDGTQSNYIKFVVTTDGFTALQEINDVPGTPVTVTIDVADRPASGILFYFVVDPTTGNVDLEYSIDGGTRTAFTSFTATGTILDAIQQSSSDLAVGFIGTSNTAGVELEGSWDFLSVVSEKPTITVEIDDILQFVNAPDRVFELNDYFDDNNGDGNLTYTVESNTSGTIGASIVGSTLTITYPAAPDAGDITIRATDGDMLFIEQTFTVTVTDAPVAVHRINAGGPTIAAIDGSIDWVEDTAASPNIYLTEPASNASGPSSIVSYDVSVNQTTTPTDVFMTERFDFIGGEPNMKYTLPVSAIGTYEVRLYMGNGFFTTQLPGQRVFDVTLEGVQYPNLDDIDLSATFGHEVGAVISNTITVIDGNIDIEFIHAAADNPLVNAIEVLQVSEFSAPQVLAQIPDFDVLVDAADDQLELNDFFVDNGGPLNLTFTVESNTAAQITATIVGSTLTLSYPSVVDAGTVTVRATDSNMEFVEQSFDVSTFGALALYRVNAGGPSLAAIDTQIDWEEDTEASPSTYLVEPGTNSAAPSGILTYTPQVDLTTTPTDLFTTERFDLIEEEPNMTYSFPVSEAGNYEVRVYAGNGFPGTADPGTRVFDIKINGVVYPEAKSLDLSGTYGHQIGTVISQVIFMPAAGNIEVEFDHTLEDNPIANGLEILKLNSLDGPYATAGIPNLKKPVNYPDDTIDLANFFGDDGGVPNLTFEVSNNTNGLIGAVITGTTLTISYPGVAALSDITIKAIDQDLNEVEQSFTVEASTGTVLVYRVNSGGPEVVAIDGDLNWEEDTTDNPSVYLSEPATNAGGLQNTIVNYDASVDLATTPTTIFETERSDLGVGAPNLTYTFPVPTNGNYEVRLYMGNSFNLTSKQGERIFNVAIEGFNYPDLKDIDLITSFGHQTGGVFSHVVNVMDGAIDIEFIHDAIENPLVNGIEIFKVSDDDSPIYAHPISAQVGFPGQALDGSLGVVATGGDGNLSFAASNLPPGVFIEPTNGQIGGQIDMATALAGSPYTVTITVDDSDGFGGDVVSFDFVWTIQNYANARINAGGVVHITPNLGTWVENAVEGVQTTSTYSVNTGLISNTSLNLTQDASLPAYIDTASLQSLYAQERYGTEDALDMEFSLPVFNGDYVVNLYFANDFGGTQNVGDRVFDLIIEGNIAFDNFDAVAQFGHQVAGMVSFPVTVSDGEMNIVFGKEVYEPMVNAIEIFQVDAAFTALSATLANQQGFIDDVVDISFAATGGNSGAAYNYFFQGLPDGLTFDAATGQVTGTIAASALTGGPNGDGVFNVKYAAVNDGVAPLYGSFTWTVLENQAPVAIISADVTSGNAALLVNFTGSGSTDDQNDIVSYDWDFGTGDTSTDADPSYTFAAGGVYTVTLTVTDGGGLTSQATVDITVNGAPVAIASADVIAGNAALEVNFTGSGSTDDNNDIVSYEWDFGTGDMSSDADPTYTFTTGGVYDVTLTVTDGGGLSSTTTVQINVNGAPVAIASADVISGNEPLEVNFTGSGSTDDNNDIVSYEWDFGTGDMSTDTDPTYTFATSGVYDVTLTVTDGGGLSSTTTVQINVNGAPVAIASADVIAGNEALEVNFTGSGSTDDNNDIVSYEWDFGTGDMSTEANPTYTFTTGGVYTVTLTVTDGGGLTSTTSLVITVNGAPVAIATADVTEGDAPLLVNFTGSGSTDDNNDIVSYAWDFGNGDSSTDADPSYTFATDGNYTVTLTVTDGGGLTSTATIDITVLVDNNTPPIARIIANPTEGDAPLPVIFDGSTSSDDAGIVSYLWDFADGTTSTQINPVKTFNTPGVFVVVLTVTDTKGITDTAEVTITVNDPNANQAPVAVAGASVTTGQAPLSVTFTGSNSTDDNGIVSYSWVFGDGGTSSEINPTHVYTTAGVYDAVLTVEDAEGLTDSATITITVEAAPDNEAPQAVATAAPLTGEAPLLVSFTGDGSSDDKGIVSYLWDFMDGTTSTEANPMHTFTGVGTFNVTLTVADQEGLTDTANVTIQVTEPATNEAPEATASATPLSGFAPLEVSFDSTGSTDDVGIVSYSWDFGNGDSSTDANPTYTFTTAGMYTVVLTVTDGEGLTDTASVVITVNDDNMAPVAMAAATPLSGIAPLEVSFDSSGSSDDDAIVSYFWDFDDGTTSTEANPTHTFTAIGTYNVSLTVQDAEGLSDTDVIEIVVTPINQGPTAVATANITTGEAPLLVQFTGSASSDDKGIVEYFWDFDDGVTSTEINPSHQFNFAGTFQVVLRVEDAEGLSNSTTLTIVVTDNNPTGTGTEMNLVVVQNPAQNVAEIAVQNMPPGAVVSNIYVHDSTGRLIATYLPQQVFENGNYMIPVGTLRDELYFVTISTLDGNSSGVRVLVKNN